MDQLLVSPKPRPSTSSSYRLSPAEIREWAELTLPISATKSIPPGQSSEAPAPPAAPTPPIREFTPRSLSSSHSTPSTTSASSPAPSEASQSSASWPYYPQAMVEIEEIDDDVDSGIELLHGEFEEAPENYGYGYNGQDDDDQSEIDGDDEHRALLLKLKKMCNQHGSSFFGSSTPASKKRTYAESLDGSDYDGGYGSGDNTDSESGGRIRRRKLAPMRTMDRRQYSRMSTPEFFTEMEL